MFTDSKLDKKYSQIKRDIFFVQWNVRKCSFAWHGVFNFLFSVYINNLSPESPLQKKNGFGEI